MTKQQKIIKLVQKLGRNPIAHLKIRGDKIFSAEWDTNHHNGDIEDYKETPATEKEMLSFIASLEDDLTKLVWSEHKQAFKQTYLKNLYSGN